jgi:hypothetical protein
MKNPVIIQALIWYFIDMPKAILTAWKNFLVFGLNYFSLPLLLKTFFSRWRRYGDSYGKLFEFWRNFETFVFNVMSRVIGMVFRTIFIFVGIFTIIFIFVGGLLVLLGWYVLPVILIGGFFFGIGLLF